MTRALPYSQIGPLEKGQPIPLEGDAILRLDRAARDYICGKRLCGGLLGWRIALVDGRSCGVLFCYANGDHRGIRRPRRER